MNDDCHMCANAAEPGAFVPCLEHGEGAPSGAPEPAPSTDPQWWIDGDVNRCSVCGSTRPHTIRRLPGKTLVCDACHEGTKR